MIVYIDDESNQSETFSIPEKVDLNAEIRKVEQKILEKKKYLIGLKNEQTKRLIEMGLD